MYPVYYPVLITCENVLLPFDGSEGATGVLHHAGEVAQRADATVHAVYVADTTRDSVTEKTVRSVPVPVVTVGDPE